MIGGWSGSRVQVEIRRHPWRPTTIVGAASGRSQRAVALRTCPGVATAQRSGPALASLALDERWAALRDGAFVVRDKVTEVQPVAQDRDREHRLWEATAQLLEKAGTAH
jgi:hypothetical protein